MFSKKIIIGCDNAAVELKDIVKELLQNHGIEVEDIGVNTSNDTTMYPDIAAKLCTKIQESNFENRGILLCGTGIGMAMMANKFEGIYAAVCHDNFAVERSVLSNDGNVLCLGARIVGAELAKKIVKEWINLEYKVSKSQDKIDRMREIEKLNFTKTATQEA